MIAGPEVSYLIAQYEAACGTKEGTEHTSHHEETERAQRAFLEKSRKALTNHERYGQSSPGGELGPAFHLIERILLTTLLPS